VEPLGSAEHRLKNIALEQESQTRGLHVACLMRLYDPRHHKKVENMAEITVLRAVKVPSTLY